MQIRVSKWNGSEFHQDRERGFLGDEMEFCEWGMAAFQNGRHYQIAEWTDWTMRIVAAGIEKFRNLVASLGGM
jgi:hypothetical protein